MKGMLGHYPNRVSDKENYTVSQVLKYKEKLVLYTIEVTITNDAANAEANTSSLRYGLKDYLPSHIWLSAKQGVIQLHYRLDYTDNVKIGLYSAYGVLLGVVSFEKQNAGQYFKEIDLESLGLPFGTYILKVTTGAYREALSITVAR